MNSEIVGIQEGKIVKGGRNDKPTRPRPDAPEGQAGKTLEYWSKRLKTKVIDFKCSSCGSALSLAVIKNIFMGWKLFCRHCKKTPVVSHSNFNKVISKYFNPGTQKEFEEMYCDKFKKESINDN